MSSKLPSDALDLERDVPTSLEDVAALARLRPTAVPDLLVHIDRLSAPDWLPPARDLRRTAAGWAPFDL